MPESFNNRLRARKQAELSLCPLCGDRHAVEPLPFERWPPFRRWRSILLRFYRDWTGCKDHYLRNDEKGRAFLLALVLFRLPREDVEHLAWWITPQELDEMRQKATGIEPTRRNASEIINLTRAVLDKYGWRVNKKGKRVRAGILTFPACNETRKQAMERRNAAKNAARKVKRTKEREKERAMHAARCRDPREVALLEAMALIRRRPGVHFPDDDDSVSNIMDAIGRTARAEFPPGRDSFTTVVHRLFDRLEERGVVTTRTGRRKRFVRLRLCENEVFGLTPPKAAKPLKYMEPDLTLSWPLSSEGGAMSDATGSAMPKEESGYPITEAQERPRQGIDHLDEAPVLKQTVRMQTGLRRVRLAEEITTTKATKRATSK